MKAIPRISIAHLPTPVESMPNLSEALGKTKFLIKRDDQTGLALGGNKTRKLEFLMAGAVESGAKTLLTAGAIQSNHCRQTAAAAARCGMECILILTGDPTEPSGNLLLDHLFNAKIVWATRETRDQILQQKYEEAQSAGKKPYLIPYGGSNRIGATAYAFALQEMLEQGVSPDWIVFPSSSGGTQAGLVLGARLLGYKGKILGISVDEAAADLKVHVAELASQASELLGEALSFSAQDVLVNDDYLGGGYGVMGDVEKEAVHLFAAKEGILVDPVYSGRAAAGMIGLLRQGFFKEGETVLFWHTGGTPALFAERYRNIID